MPNSTDYYIGDDWTIETITEHFRDLGFTNIRAVPCEPDDDNYEINIREMVIETGWFSTDPWEAGDEFKSDAEISIFYNEFPLLTTENCSDLAMVLSSQDMSYLTFAGQYDERYVKFDAYVTNHHTYDGGTSHIIEVTGGHYDGESEISPYSPELFDGLIIQIGDRTWDNSINYSVQPGDHVVVSGRIDESWSKYYKMLYVECLYLERR